MAQPEDADAQNSASRLAKTSNDDNDTAAKGSQARFTTSVHAGLLVPSSATGILDLSNEILEMILRVCLPSVVGFPPILDMCHPDTLVLNKQKTSILCLEGALTESDLELMHMAPMGVCKKFHNISTALLFRESTFCINLRCNEFECKDENCLWSHQGLHQIRNRKIECLGLSESTHEQYPALNAKMAQRGLEPLAPSTHIPWNSFCRFRNIRVTARATYHTEPRIVLCKLHNLVGLLERRQLESSNVDATKSAAIRHIDFYLRVDGEPMEIEFLHGFLERFTDLLCPMAGQLRNIPSVKITSGNEPQFNDLWEDCLDSDHQFRRSGLHKWIAKNTYFTRNFYKRLNRQNFQSRELEAEPTLLESVLWNTERAMRGKESRWLANYPNPAYWDQVWGMIAPRR
ncbi:MAG: hypothetical protein M1831_006508 [Alyxoria varia]|nr:MAG: hypothetical protein M1831_006508 [Alyxoria varia]